MTVSFNPEASMVARRAMQAYNPILTEKYVHLIELLTLNPDAAGKLRGANAPGVGSREYIEIQAKNFSDARKPWAPEPPSTVPDQMVSLILHHYFNLSSDSLERVKQEHSLSMAAENLVGDLLERYLADVMEPLGWIWCSGSTVKAVDFIKPPSRSETLWTLMQIKNRDNSENSSSAAIRNGTTIKKWFRTFSRKEATNWGNFPDPQVAHLVSEDGFTNYAKIYLRELKNIDNHRKNGSTLCE